MRRERDSDEAGVLDEGAKLSFQESAGNSTGPEGDVLLGPLRDRLADDDVSNLQSPTGLEDAVGLGQHGGFVRTEVDHSIRNNDVDAVVLDGERFEEPLAKLDVCLTKELRVRTGLGQHRRRHIDTNDLAAWTDHPCCQESIEASPGPEINDLFARGQIAPREGITDAGEALNDRIGQRLHALSRVPQAIS